MPKSHQIQPRNCHSIMKFAPFAYNSSQITQRSNTPIVVTYWIPNVLTPGFKNKCLALCVAKNYNLRTLRHMRTRFYKK